MPSVVDSQACRVTLQVSTFTSVQTKRQVRVYGKSALITAIRRDWARLQDGIKPRTGSNTETCSWLILALPALFDQLCSVNGNGIVKGNGTLKYKVRSLPAGALLCLHQSYFCRILSGLGQLQSSWRLQQTHWLLAGSSLPWELGILCMQWPVTLQFRQTAVLRGRMLPMCSTLELRAHAKLPEETASTASCPLVTQPHVLLTLHRLLRRWLTLVQCTCAPTSCLHLTSGWMEGLRLRSPPLKPGCPLLRRCSSHKHYHSMHPIKWHTFPAGRGHELVCLQQRAPTCSR